MSEEVTFRQSPDRPADPVPLSVDNREGFPLTDVHVVTATLGADGTEVDALLKAGARGLVVAGFTTGTPARTGQKERLLGTAEDEIPIVVCNRGLEGIKSVDDAFVSGRMLQPQKACC